MSNIKRAVVFAGYSPDGRIYKDVFPYLEELRKYSEYIIAVYDNKNIEQTELEKLKMYVDEYIIDRHGEYDFGSYKRGFFRLKEKQILDSTDKLLFCNDSIIYQGKSLDLFFKLETEKDFYGLTSYRKEKTENDVNFDDLFHIQSYFLSISKNIYNKIWFNDFISSIKKELDKDDIINRYEIGISRLIEKNGYKIDSFYPTLSCASVNPCLFFLSKTSCFSWGEEQFIFDFCEDEEFFLFEKRNVADLYTIKED